METESYEEAEDYIRQSIRIRYVLLHPNFISLLFSCDREKHFGEDSFQCMQAYDILAGILCKKGRLDEAEEKAHTSIDTKIKILGHNHPESWAFTRWYVFTRFVCDKTSRALLLVLGGILMARSNIAAARQKIQRALSIFTCSFGEDHPSIKKTEQILEGKNL